MHHTTKLTTFIVENRGCILSDAEATHQRRPVKGVPIFNHEYVMVVPRDEKKLSGSVRRKLRKVGPNGEKALVSLTMILSMFLAKPSPFCILDEVDAPLDDDNLGHFARIIKDLSKDYQFLVITHNKLTMESADVLYGITMREPGVSQVVSVRMKDVA